MKILFVNTVSSGSTGNICRQLYRAMEKQGHDCYFAYGRGEKDSSYKTIKIGNKITVLLHVFLSRLFDLSGFGSYLSTKLFIKKIERLHPDIIHLHNLHGYYINIKVLTDYLKKHSEIRKIWTLHDCWAYTGHCVYYSFAQCEQWREGCSGCSFYRDYPKSYVDKSNRNYNAKRDCFSNIDNMLIVCVSDWLKNEVKNSFLNQYKIEVVKNGIDINIFKNLEMRLSYPKIILGVSQQWSERKGWKDFVELRKKLPDEYKIVMVGVDSKLKKRLPSDIDARSHTNSVEELVYLYNSCYVLFNASKEETFGLINFEAQACGAPVITYGLTGTKETIYNKNSYIVSDIKSVYDLIISNKLCHLQRDQYDISIFDKSSMIKGYNRVYNVDGCLLMEK